MSQNWTDCQKFSAPCSRFHDLNRADHWTVSFGHSRVCAPHRRFHGNYPGRFNEQGIFCISAMRDNFERSPLCLYTTSWSNSIILRTSKTSILGQFQWYRRSDTLSRLTRRLSSLIPAPALYYVICGEAVAFWRIVRHPLTIREPDDDAVSSHFGREFEANSGNHGIVAQRWAGFRFPLHPDTGRWRHPSSPEVGASSSQSRRAFVISRAPAKLAVGYYRVASNVVLVPRKGCVCAPRRRG
jgi:hypothetical protein